MTLLDHTKRIGGAYDKNTSLKMVVISIRNINIHSIGFMAMIMCKSKDTCYGADILRQSFYCVNSVRTYPKWPTMYVL